jgi:uncharacterized membrane protein YfhO
VIYDYKFYFAILAVFLTLYAYTPYLIGIFRGKTKPHCFTWLIWSIVAVIATLIQILEGGGMGSWPTIVATLTCFLITFLSIKYKTEHIKRIDYVLFTVSLCSIPLWVITNSPVYSALLVTGIEIVGALPTIIKSWHHPKEEVMSTYGLNSIRYLLSILSLSTISIATIAYPIGMVFMNGVIFAILFIRRNV